MIDETIEPPDGAGEVTHRDGGAVFWIGTVLGWLVIVIGIRMGLHDRELKPGVLLKWVAGGLVLHDAVWLPLVAVVGAAIAFVVRRRVPLVVAWALATSAVLTLIAWPFVRGYGRRPDVPSALQRNYAHGLVVYIALTWMVAIAAFVGGRLRRRRISRGATSS